MYINVYYEKEKGGKNITGPPLVPKLRGHANSDFTKLEIKQPQF